MTGPRSEATAGPEAGAGARILAGVAGALLLLLGAVCTLGTALAAPIGPVVARRIARRKGRSLTWGAAWLSAVLACFVVLAVLFGVLSQSMGRDIRRAQRSAGTASLSQPVAELPAWMRYVFPQASQRPDPLAERVLRSRVYTVWAALMGIGMALAFFAAVVGSVGWGAVLLLRYAASGRFAA